MSLVITGATGQLGRLVIQALLRTVPPAEIVAMVRDPAKATDLAELGVHVQRGDYSQPETLASVFKPGDKILLISSNEVGQRLAQHQAVIDAARHAGAAQIAYTSVLHADSSLLGLAEEHRQTEAALAASGVSWVALRNGWYTENYTARIPPAIAHNALAGSAGEGRIASASREDYADAAAAVLTGDLPGSTVLELAGDEAYTLAEFAAGISKVSGTPVAYVDMPEAEYAAVLVGAGLPGPLGSLIANGDACAAKGALFDDSKTLSKLIGRPTTPFAQTVAAALHVSS